MQNPNEVKFVTKLNRFERATTFIKERFSFEVHRKSYSRWKKWTFDLGLRKFSNMFDFPNIQLKFHHDTSSNEKVFNMKVVSLDLTIPKRPRSPHLAKVTKDLCMGASWRTIWMFSTSIFHTQLHGLPTWIQHDAHSFLDQNTSFHGPSTLHHPTHISSSMSPKVKRMSS